MKPKVIGFVTNNIAGDQRLIKVGTTLQNAGYDFELIGFNHRGKPELNLPFKTRRLSLFFTKGFLFYSEVQLRIFIFLLFKNKVNSILLSNDLDTLLPIYFISKIFKKPLVYDSHEIFSELPSLKKGSFQKRVWKFLERFFLPKIKYFYTVSESYGNWFFQQYSVKPIIVRNIPFSLNDNFKSKDDENIILYQGALNISRGLESMIQAMKYINDAKFWIVGDGPIREKLEELTIKLGLEDKVIFYGKILPDELKKITPKASVGISLEQDNGISYRFALPNKLFDYIQARVPVLGSLELIEVSEIINKYKIGEVVSPREPKLIADKVKKILQAGKKNYLSNLELASKEFVWEREESKLLSVFQCAEIKM